MHLATFRGGVSFSDLQGKFCCDDDARFCRQKLNVPKQKTSLENQEKKHL